MATGPKARTTRKKSATIKAKHYAAIGQFVHAWAALEFEIDQMIWVLGAVASCVEIGMRRSPAI